jgi:ribosomal protein S18 acetylase RimI-like enzyme
MGATARRPTEPGEWASVIDAVGERSVELQDAGAFLGDPSTLAVAGYLDGQGCGYLAGYLVTRVDGSPMLIVYDVSVAQGCRRHGVGTAMVSLALEHARRRGASKAWVVTDHGNDAAAGLYRATGATFSADDDLIMWWPLQ